MKSFKIDNDYFSLICESFPYERDNSFTILLKSIKVIGIENKMIGDDDTDILYFIDNHSAVYTITLEYLNNHDDFIYLINKRFLIDIKSEASKLVDFNKVIFPAEIHSELLFQPNNFFDTKKKLSKSVIDYIKSSI